MVGGGEIAGLLKFRNEDLAEGRNLLGRLAHGHRARAERCKTSVA